VSEQKTVEEKASGPSKFFEVNVEAYSDKIFAEAYFDFSTIPTDFKVLLTDDKRIEAEIKTDFAYHIGYIESLIDTLLKARYHCPAGEQLNRPDLVKEFAAIMLRFKALYEYYATGNKVNEVDLHNTLLDIMTDLENFVRKAFEQLKA